VPTQSSILPDEKQQTQAHIAIEKQNKQLNAKTAEMETAQKTKSKATTETSNTVKNNMKAAGQYKSALLLLQGIGIMPP
jgi:predicted flap endonuclease-1-like 5' DNA nuclease